MSDRVFFIAEDVEHGRELWSMTGGGTDVRLAADLTPGSAGSSLGDPLAAKQGVAFRKYDPETRNYQVWFSDGTEAGTVRLGPEDLDLRRLVVSGETIYFTTNTQIWVSDGTPDGTRALDVLPGTDVYYIDSFYPVAQGVIFEAATATGRSIYFSDGGLGAAVDLLPAEERSLNISSVHVNGGKTFFSTYGYDNEVGDWTAQVYVTDGTAEGTASVLNIVGNNPVYRFYSVGEKTVFFAQSGEQGQELFVSDGTAAGTFLLADMNPGPGSSFGRAGVEVGGKLYFIADTGSGDELWMTDGTVEGTGAAKDLGGYTNEIVALDGNIYFVARAEGSYQLWRADGTPEGFVLLKEFAVGGGLEPVLFDIRGDVANLTVFNGKVYFVATTPEQGSELWVTDGSVEGTMLLKDINPGVPGSRISELQVSGNSLVFNADDGQHGYEVWTSDGTAEGTQLRADINTADAGSSVRDLVSFGGKLFASVPDNKDAGVLWAFDGSTWVPYSSHDPDLTFSGVIAEYGDRLLLSARHATNGWQVWSYDGTDAAPTLVASVGGQNSGGLVSVAELQGRLVFSGNSGMWITDGTQSGTLKLGDVRTISNVEATVLDGRVVFIGLTPEDSYEVWSTDGTPGGTVKLTALPAEGYLPELIGVAEGRIIYRVYNGDNYTVFSTDGTVDGTYDLPFTYWNYQQAIELGGKLLLRGSSTETGDELWITDGTVAGSVALSDAISPGSSSSYAFPVGTLNGLAYFGVSQYTSRSLYITDGTPEGTRELTPLSSDPNFGITSGIGVLDGKLLFATYTYGGLDGIRELWGTDGTAGGTAKITDGIGTPYDTREPLLLGGKLYYIGYADDTGHTIWVTDGTAEGSRAVTGDGKVLDYQILGEIGGKLLFTFSSANSAVGAELWITDGTEAGTQLLRDINPGSGDSYANGIGLVDGLFYFRANNGTNGQELWVTDGTPEGTRLAHNFNTTGEGSFPFWFTVVSGFANVAPEAVEIRNAVTTLPEDTSTTSAIKVADISVLDDGDGTNSLTLSGADKDYFEIVGTGLYLKAGTHLDYETNPILNVTVSASDASLDAPAVSTSLAIAVADVDDNAAPTAVTITPVLTSLAENAPTTSATKVATIAITDDGIGSNAITLGGADAALFEVVDGALYLKAGTALDFETKTSLSVTVSVADASLSAPPVTANFSLAVTDVAGVIIYGTSGKDTIDATTTVAGQPFPSAESDLIDSGSGNDKIAGLGGDDTLIGGAGADEIDGGAGNNTASYVSSGRGVRVDLTAATASGGEAAGDKLTNIQNLIGSAFADVLTGDAGANVLTGLGGADILDGQGGADTLVGGTGSDIYFVDSVLDVVTELAGEGVDTVNSSVSLTLAANVEWLRLVGTGPLAGTGNDLANTIIGNAEGNTLSGGAGDGRSDRLIGRGGDDLYLVETGDTVTESAGQGYDTVQASVSFTLSNNVERLELTEAGGAIDATGNNSANLLIGNSSANAIRGLWGNDTIEGGGGDDLLVGGVGNDTASYAGAAAAVTVNLAVTAKQATGGAGVDQLSGFENLTGSAHDDTLTGSASANLIDGGAGADNMTGGAGNDTYIVDNLGDVVVELSGGGTADTILSSVSFDLGVAGANVERLTLTGAAAVSATGNALANIITGNEAANLLTSGGGKDTFVFNTALGAGNVDVITDYVAADDSIWLEKSIFKGLSSGALSAAAFRIGASAADSSDRIIYDSATGKLYFDRDGSGVGEQIQFAKLEAGLALTSSEFLVV